MSLSFSALFVLDAIRLFVLTAETNPNDLFTWSSISSFSGIIPLDLSIVHSCCMARLNFSAPRVPVPTLITFVTLLLSPSLILSIGCISLISNVLFTTRGVLLFGRITLLSLF
eukprot:TRINITY_DN2810_c0_g2_i5.p1 TRINITY_DN2810_c0_g2~~TRINITY_DN2810_c0_g2_i5.p1  ORF type:complete len:113 (+),score=8.44 TRINITY_DN2810_c0_g2_i5:267-605(+)